MKLIQAITSRERASIIWCGYSSISAKICYFGKKGQKWPVATKIELQLYLAKNILHSPQATIKHTLVQLATTNVIGKLYEQLTETI